MTFCPHRQTPLSEGTNWLRHYMQLCEVVHLPSASVGMLLLFFCCLLLLFLLASTIRIPLTVGSCGTTGSWATKGGPGGLGAAAMPLYYHYSAQKTGVPSPWTGL